MRKALLICGIAASLVYVVANAVASLAWPAYRSALETIGEVSAFGAPSDPVWLALGFAYSGLLVAFGVGVWRGASSRDLQLTGFALIALGVLGPLWPADHLQLVFGAITTILVFIAVITGMSSFGVRFRVYSIATLGVLFASGVLTFAHPASDMTEHIGIAAYVLWIGVLSATLLRSENAEKPRRSVTAGPRCTGAGDTGSSAC